MAKSKRRSQSRNAVEEDFGLDEVDAFQAANEKILFEAAEPIKKTKNNRGYEDEDSDEGVMNISDSEDDESGDEDIHSANEVDGDDDDAEFFGKRDEADEELEEDGTWGDRKSNYYGADDIDDEETAKDIEEEALRQQKKHLQELNMDDYVDEELDEEWSKSAKKHDYGEVLKSTSEDSQKYQNILSLDSKSKKKYLSSVHPEYIPLSKELTKLSPILKELQENKNQNEVSEIKYVALSSYVGSLTLYFSIFLKLITESNNEDFTMKDHPIMEAILSSRETWRQANELLDISTDDISDEEEAPGINSINTLEENDEESEDFDSAEEDFTEEEQEDSEDSEIEDVDIDISKPRIFKRAKALVTEDFAEGQIEDVDAEEKKARKRTLRFYTSKIDQQAKKKDERYTGDLDIPYKERLFERQQRLIEEARKRGLHDNNGADLDENDSFGEEDEKEATSINKAFDDTFYQTIKSSKEIGKTQRKQAHEDAVKAAKEGKLAELQENITEDGKRAVNYQILKNKGLTPHRKKEDRNSRVKKRKKYEKAQKKLKSVRAVYSAPKGTYEGEKTGIKKNLSKSLKF